jgi:hypothetical protein
MQAIELEPLLKLLGLIGLSGIGLTAFAYWLFRTFAEKWLAAKFDKQLTDHKHAHEIELERVRFSINTLLDRTTKLHQFEFDVLPKVWALLSDTYSEAMQLTSRLQSYSDLTRMQPAHLEEFLKTTPLFEWQKEEIRKETDKTKAYIKLIFGHNLHRAQMAYAEFHRYLIRNGIFMQSDLRDRFRKMGDVIWDALIEKQYADDAPPGPGRYEKCDYLQRQGQALMETIETQLQERLLSVSLK